ncbi:MAG: MBL fold metallo-hydrolase [Pseudomonadota bacterium]|nr:MBL fold metallo-hydrolase [Pseudomonadota bacterium]
MTRNIQIGNIEVNRIIETEAPDWAPLEFFPECTKEMLDAQMHWLQPRFLDPGTGRLIFATQSYLLQTTHHNILIDSCVGEQKIRTYSAEWNLRSNTNYLAKLTAAGLSPDSIDYVLCTHLHPDHVGWNTKLVDDRWVPTFPNAKYLFSKTEHEFWKTKSAKHPTKYDDGCYQDSVLPIEEAGQALIVDDTHSLNDEILLEPSPGHTPGHTSIRLRSNGAHAVFSGDLMHSVLQCVYPNLVSQSCFDKQLARQTRKEFLQSVCESRTQVLTAHFPSPSAGYIKRSGNSYRFAYATD